VFIPQNYKGFTKGGQWLLTVKLGVIFRIEGVNKSPHGSKIEGHFYRTGLMRESTPIKQQYLILFL
jgi:hypothetical protein